MDIDFLPVRQPNVKITREELCPVCRFPLADSSHGWVKYRAPHTDHTGHYQHYGYCDIPCPQCSGGIEAKRQAQLINDLFRDSNIPIDMRDWTFATYPKDADQDAKRSVQRYMHNWLEGVPTKCGLYLYGDKGRCKTSLAISALHAWLRKGHSGVFISTARLFSKLKEAIAASKRDAGYQDRYEASQGAKLLRLVMSVELLILDDLGVECGSPYEIRELYLILEERRAQGLFTIFTSNKDARDLEHYWRSEQGVFQDALRVIDRLGEYSFAIPVAGRNQRERAERNGK